MGTGFEPKEWDMGAGCWGMKLICNEALTDPDGPVPEPKSKGDIATNNGISTDFDTNTLFGGCFGARKIVNGNMTFIDGIPVKVWCPGVLNSPTVEWPNGNGAQPKPPTCEQLAANYFIDIDNGKCWGKKFPEPEYMITCEAGVARLFIMNGAQEISPRHSSVPATHSAANDIFDIMQRAASEKRQMHFK